MSLEVRVSGGESSRAGSASSGLKLADRWYYGSSPPIPDQSDLYPHLILDTKLRPRPRGSGEESVLGSHDSHKLKRELSEDSCTGSAPAKNRRVSKVAFELRRADRAGHSSTGSCETNASTPTRNHNQYHDTPRGPDARGEPSSRGKDNPEMDLLRRKNDLLRRENDLLIMHRDRKMAALQDDVAHLQEANRELHATLSHFKDIERVRSCDSGDLMDEVKELTAKLKERDEQIEGKIYQIATLDEQLSTQERFQRAVEDLEFDFTCSSSFAKGLAELEQKTRFVANFLAQCLSSREVQKLRKKPRKKKLLSGFIRSVLGRISFLDSSPVSAMRALVFGFVRDRIFFSDCWTALHFEGYMLRELQQIIQKITPAGTLESLHRASLESMLSTNHQFEHCWIRKEVEDAQCQFMELFSPLLDLQEFEDIKDQIKRDLEIIFTGAFKARARFVPPLGARYELVQFKPGDKFDPAYMQVQGASSKPISVPSDGSVYRIKACVHGCLIEHSAKKKLSYADMLQVLSQPLIGDDERFDITEKGVLKSDRAIIILEDESAP